LDRKTEPEAPKSKSTPLETFVDVILLAVRSRESMLGADAAIEA
jgi:hypothetical protein